ncbi:hypothetical protein BJX61DRAFT_547172 [Aspergillus egyptiacus]|nr:hypothetical protein BJX61DRAFT_547172 [Aspergillus egyptiacus]
MTTRREREAEDAYERANDPSPVTGDFQDDSYAYETGNTGFSSGMPVQKDEEDYEDPMQPPFSNTNQQLEQDEREAIDKSNILRGGRTRHAKPQYPTGYSEGPEEDDLPAEVAEGTVGRSSMKRVS